MPPGDVCYGKALSTENSQMHCTVNNLFIKLNKMHLFSLLCHLCQMCSHIYTLHCWLKHDYIPWQTIWFKLIWHLQLQLYQQSTTKIYLFSYIKPVKTLFKQITLFHLCGLQQLSPGCLWVQYQRFYDMGNKQTALLLSEQTVKDKWH